MEVYEYNGILTYKDDIGSIYRMYPVTKKECLQGMDEIDAHIIDNNNPHGTTCVKIGAVPVTAKVNGREFSGDIDLIPRDLGIVLDDTLSVSGAYAESSTTGKALAKKAETSLHTGTLLSDGWSDTVPHTQTIPVRNIDGSDDTIFEEDSPLVDVDLSDVSNTSEVLFAWALVGRVVSQNGQITAYCYDDVPSTNIPLFLKVIR